MVGKSFNSKGEFWGLLHIRRLAMVFFCLFLAACSNTGRLQSETVQSDSESLRSIMVTDKDDEVNFGILVMAHGGGDEWNEAVRQSMSSLADRFPLEIAFGMADAGSIERSVRRLEAAGVEHVGVVRMFISGESWYERTMQILGLQAGAPSKEEAEKIPQPRMFMPMGFWKLDTDLSFYVSEDGLADASEMDEVLVSRINSLSKEPSQEVAIIVAHGTGSDEEDSRWIEKITERTALARASLGLNDIKVFTLREDWREKRELAEQDIRSYLEEAKLNGFTSLVVPFRVQGFGPYARVLEGLEYEANGMGLLPHSNVNLWIENQAELLRQNVGSDVLD